MKGIIINKERKSSICSFISPPFPQPSDLWKWLWQGWGGPEAGAWDSIQVSQVGARKASTWSFPRSVSRKLDQKQSSWKMNWEFETRQPHNFEILNGFAAKDLASNECTKWPGVVGATNRRGRLCSHSVTLVWNFMQDVLAFAFSLVKNHLLGLKLFFF